MLKKFTRKLWTPDSRKFRYSASSICRYIHKSNSLLYLLAKTYYWYYWWQVVEEGKGEEIGPAIFCRQMKCHHLNCFHNCKHLEEEGLVLEVVLLEQEHM